MKVAVVVARFQGYKLTEGHKSLLDRARNYGDRVVVVLGVHPIVNCSDPLNYALRERMVKQAYPDYIVWGLPNYRYNRDWCAMLDAFLYMAFPRAEKVLLGCRDSCLEIYRKDGWNNTQYLDTLDQFAGVSATAMREQIAERDTEDFRAGVIYGVQSACPRVLPAVDIAIYKQDPKVIDGNFIPRTQLLVVRKQGEAQWRFPGGALEAADPTLEAGARREGYEETGLALDTLEYVSGRRIDDWRFRRTGITVFTTFFSAPWMGGTPKPKDREIADARWIRATSVIEVTLVEEHLVLYQDFLDWLTKKETKSVEHHAADRLLQAES